ncbi:unnamed protein product [Orchesella dallaii]|uniref:PDZ domain-containing protein n=1 Tax=Orchesella dallaii TaxID=48710 RepID=A0ABP1RLT8_9HEXA
MFPDVKKLGLTGNVVVIFYTLMILQSVAIAVFAVEYLLRFSIFDSIKKQTRSKVATHDQSSMESRNKHGAILTVQPAADLTICEIQLTQEENIVTGQNGDVCGISIEEWDSTPIDYIEDVCANGAAAQDLQLRPGGHILSLNNANIQNISHSNASAVSQKTPINFVMLDNCDEATNYDTEDNGNCNIYEGDFENVEK